MHTHNHMQIGEVAEQRGCQVPGTKGAFSRHPGSGLGGELAPLQLPAHSIFFCCWSDRDVNRRPFGSDQVPTD